MRHTELLRGVVLLPLHREDQIRRNWVLNRLDMLLFVFFHEIVHLLNPVDHFLGIFLNLLKILLVLLFIQLFVLNRVLLDLFDELVLGLDGLRWGLVLDLHFLWVSKGVVLL